MGAAGGYGAGAGAAAGGGKMPEGGPLSVNPGAAKEDATMRPLALMPVVVLLAAAPALAQDRPLSLVGTWLVEHTRLTLRSIV
jgi:hypothetical protein